ncbi:hypothetical protein [Collinsella intestinalis]|uniref:hypothetical protein n=1 Tax=Collinsella intestinalis TaxID=147207 RepID=UPI0019596913|nr:hypothetical protein [Collinsella intestinalis]
MTEYRLASGDVVTDEELEREASSFEDGSWEGRLENVRVGRPPLADEPLVTVPVKFPASMVAAIDRKTTNRSDYIRKAVAATL